jgi:uncharacterized FlgJ-related protein
MATWQKALLITLGISTFNTVISMENVTKDDIQYYARQILIYTRGQKHEKMFLRQVEDWLTEERFKIPETKDWNFLIASLLRETSRENSFIEELKGPTCSGTENYLTNEVIEIIKTVAQNLKPYESCKGLLVKPAHEIIEKTEHILANGPF